MARIDYFTPRFRKNDEEINLVLNLQRPSLMSTPQPKFGFLWVTLGLFIFSLLGHFIFAWYAYVDEQTAHAQAIEYSGYLIQTLRDMFENWQSEFLQLLWQVGGLAFLWWVGSPQSKEGDDRKEELLELILKKVDPENAERQIKHLEKKYPKS